MELPGALPLGIVSDISYDVTRIDLGSGSRLTFCSDGVVEAQDKRGQLFGFERAREFSTQPPATIAETAKAFGQHYRNHGEASSYENETRSGVNERAMGSGIGEDTNRSMIRSTAD